MTIETAIATDASKLEAVAKPELVEVESAVASDFPLKLLVQYKAVDVAFGVLLLAAVWLGHLL